MTDIILYLVFAYAIVSVVVGTASLLSCPMEDMGPMEIITIGTAIVFAVGILWPILAFEAAVQRYDNWKHERKQNQTK